MDGRIKSAEKANAVPPSALLYNRKNGLYISKHRTGVGHKMENVVTGNATARAYEPRYIRLNANDNVAIVVNDLGLPAKSRFACGLELRSFVPQGHKVALADIAEGAPIRRYNEVIGTAAQPILAGEWVDESWSLVSAARNSFPSGSCRAAQTTASCACRTRRSTASAL